MKSNLDYQVMDEPIVNFSKFLLIRKLLNTSIKGNTIPNRKSVRRNA